MAKNVVKKSGDAEDAEKATADGEAACGTVTIQTTAPKANGNRVQRVSPAFWRDATRGKSCTPLPVRQGRTLREMFDPPTTKCMRDEAIPCFPARNGFQPLAQSGSSGRPG